MLPKDVHPILVTDAGFGGPWFRAVEAMGWLWLGRLRNTTTLKPTKGPKALSQWVSCNDMYLKATRVERESGQMEVARKNPLMAHLVLHAKPPQGRKHHNRQGVPARNSSSREHA